MNLGRRSQHAIALVFAALISACGGGVVTENVISATLQSIAVTPAAPSIAKGVIKPFTATGTYSDGTSKDITASVTWNSANTSVATVNASGLAMGVFAGTSTIAATMGTISGNTTLTVTAAVLQSIAVTPANTSIPKGLAQQLTATGTYSDGTSQDITATITWSSGTTSVATVNTTGLAIGVAAGTSTITATMGTISGSTTLTVTAAVLQSIAVTPANPSIPKGLNQQLTATGTYSDSTSQNITGFVAWTSGTTSVATVNASGLATGVAAGTSTITATMGAISGNTTLTVTAAVLQSIAVTPANPSISPGHTQQLWATGTYSDGTSQNITATVAWSSGNTSVATVNPSGLTSGVALGTATITAKSGTISGSTVLSVTTYSIGGSVIGLSGSGLVLQNNGGDNLSIASNGTFTFATPLFDGTTYNVTVLGTPAGELCSLTSSTGTLGTSNITNVAVSCYSTTGPSLALFVGNMNGPGSVDGSGAAARFNQPAAVATDSAGNIYVADTANNTIRKITPAGMVTTLAGSPGICGSADGTGSAATFCLSVNITAYHVGVATDSAGNVYVADSGNNTIRKITPAGVVTTLAGSAGMFGGYVDGTGSAARFSSPSGVATDSAGNVYVGDTGNRIIRKITPVGVVTTFAGTAGVIGSADGTGPAAGFNWPAGVATDSAGNVYVADMFNDTIRKITPAAVVTTLAGTAGAMGTTNGTGSAARFTLPSGVATDSAGNVYVTELNDIRKITPAAVVTTFAAVYGSGVATDSAANVYVADGSSMIVKITPAAVVTTQAGTAPVCGNTNATGAAARFCRPNGAATDSAGNIYVADANNKTVRKITPTGVVTTLAGPFAGGTMSSSIPYAVATDSAGNIYVADTGNSNILKITPAGVVTTLAGTAGVTGSADGTGAAASFRNPTGIATDSAGDVYVVDSGNRTIRMITPTGVVTTLAGSATAGGSTDGTGTAARFGRPYGVATDSAGNLYVTDRGNNNIRMITPAGVVTTLSGNAGVTGSADGTGSAASFNSPLGITVSSAGNLYVADSGNSTIRKITPAGVVSTVVGVTEQAGFIAGALPGGLSYPSGVATSGSSLYVTTEDGVALVNNVP
jgi:hypothetical protein